MADERHPTVTNPDFTFVDQRPMRYCAIHGPQGEEAMKIMLTEKAEHYCLACFAEFIRERCQPLTDAPRATPEAPHD